MATLPKSVSQIALNAIRIPSIRSSQSFREQVRHNHALAYQLSAHPKRPRDQERMRPFHVSPKIDTGHDASPIDFAFMPEHTLEASSPPEIMRVPLLPDNSTPLPQSQNHQETIEPVVRPQISTISANSTHIESPSSMTEVTDNHAIDLDPFNLTSKVVASASKAIDTSVKEDQEPGAVKELWNGLLDDLFGSKKLGRT